MAALRGQSHACLPENGLPDPRLARRERVRAARSQRDPGKPRPPQARARARPRRTPSRHSTPSNPSASVDFRETAPEIGGPNRTARSPKVALGRGDQLPCGDRRNRAAHRRDSRQRSQGKRFARTTDPARAAGPSCPNQEEPRHRADVLACVATNGTAPALPRRARANQTADLVPALDETEQSWRPPAAAGARRLVFVHRGCVARSGADFCFQACRRYPARSTSANTPAHAGSRSRRRSGGPDADELGDTRSWSNQRSRSGSSSDRNRHPRDALASATARAAGGTAGSP